MENWFSIKNEAQVLSPALLFYPDRIQRNIEKMLKIAGTAERLRPHTKTYKCKEIIAMQLDAGIHKFKCATLTEAQLLAESGAKDILLAYPLIGPGQAKFVALQKQFPNSIFSVLIDHEAQIEAWKQHVSSPLNIFIDLDVGMHRTGIAPELALALLQELDEAHFHFKGWHVYDGHIHDTDVNQRRASTEQAFTKVADLLNQIIFKESIEVVCGGSITFPIHATHQDRILSPGTTLLWDQGYSSNFPDLPFEIAATVMSRVISKPSSNSICLDLGHKAVASEMQVAPVYFPQIPDATLVVHSEEHLVLESNLAHKFPIGTVLYGIPEHICPTVALHEQAGIVYHNELKTFWTIEARKRIYRL